MKGRMIIVLLLVASVALNVALAHKLRRFNHPLTPTFVQSLQPGFSVPPFEAMDVHGQIQKIAYNDTSQPTVLYIFTPPCSWCARNMDNLRRLLDQAGGHYRFIGLSLSEETLPQYVDKNHLTLPVYAGLSPETLKTYKLGSTPQTIVISSEGKVLQDWVGAYVGKQKSQVEAFFHVSLPGLRDLPETPK